MQFAKGRIAAATIFLALIFTCGQRASAASEKLAVEVSSVGEDTLRNILEDSPLTIVRTGPTTIIETDGAGYKRLLAEDGLAVVRLVAGQTTAALMAQRRASDETDAIEFVVRLRTASAQALPDGAINAAAAQNASHSAQIVSRRRLKENLPPVDDFGPGMLLVRGLDNKGTEISRVVVQDPRLVRYEAVGADKRLTGRRDFLRVDARLHVTIPYDPRVATLSIAGDTAAGEKELARVPVR